MTRFSHDFCVLDLSARSYLSPHHPPFRPYILPLLSYCNHDDQSKYLSRCRGRLTQSPSRHRCAFVVGEYAGMFLKMVGRRRTRPGSRLVLLPGIHVDGISPLSYLSAPQRPLLELCLRWFRRMDPDSSPLPPLPSPPSPRHLWPSRTHSARLSPCTASPGPTKRGRFLL